MEGRFVAYYRVSTEQQGRSGLGLEAHQKSVTDYLNGGNWSVIAEFTEVETGKRNDRSQLEHALASCRKHKAKLVIAKFDRLSRNLAFIAALMDSSIEFVTVDNPHANRLTLHILAAVAQHGSLGFFFCNLDSVGETYPENDLWQLVLSIEATPMFLGSLSKLEDHGESGLAR
jgi:Resolvase, N terminal domain